MLVSVTDRAGQRPAAAAENAASDSGDQQLMITADRLVADSGEHFSEFSGNVKALQGKTVIWADFLKIYFKKSQSPATDLNAGEDSIEKIVATGNVKINFEDTRAQAREAAYTTETQLLVLTGPDSRMTSGKNTISGSRIILDRTNGRITVESGAAKQVEAFFYTEGKGLE